MKKVWVDNLFQKQAFTEGAGLIKSCIVDMEDKLAGPLAGAVGIYEKHTGTGTIKIEMFAAPTRSGPWVECCTDVAASAAADTDNGYLPTLTHIGRFLKVQFTASAVTVTGADGWLVSR